MLGRHLAHDAEGKVQMVRALSSSSIQSILVWARAPLLTTPQNTFHFMGMACLSKLAASVITYPALVLKSRLQVLLSTHLKPRFAPASLNAWLGCRSDRHSSRGSWSAVRGRGGSKAC
jgi:hypothetical protein